MSTSSPLRVSPALAQVLGKVLYDEADAACAALFPAQYVGPADPFEALAPGDKELCTRPAIAVSLELLAPAWVTAAVDAACAAVGAGPGARPRYERYAAVLIATLLDDPAVAL